MDLLRWVVMKRMSWGWANVFTKGRAHVTFATKREAQEWAERHHPGERFLIVTLGDILWHKERQNEDRV